MLFDDSSTKSFKMISLLINLIGFNLYNLYKDEVKHERYKT